MTTISAPCSLHTSPKLYITKSDNHYNKLSIINIINLSLAPTHAQTVRIQLYAWLWRRFVFCRTGAGGDGLEADVCVEIRHVPDQVLGRGVGVPHVQVPLGAPVIG